MDIVIKKAVLDNLTEIQDLFKQTIMATCQKEYTLKERTVWSNAVQKTEKWTNSIQNEYFIIAIIDKKIVGFSSLKSNDYLNLMYVHKDYTRKGIANKMFKNIKAKSDELGGGKLSADVSKTARPFFEKKGFRVIKENKNLIENKIVINYRMSQ